MLKKFSFRAHELFGFQRRCCIAYFNYYYFYSLAFFYLNCKKYAFLFYL